MGVEGAVGFLVNQGHRWSQPIQLTSSATPAKLAGAVVVDATKAMDKFVMSHLGASGLFPKCGTSMKQLADFYRAFLKRFTAFNITVHIVLNGGRKSEDSFGPMVSGLTHFERSSRNALRDFANSRRRNYDLPELALNVLKEVICELRQSENCHIECHQATYEVYPKLVHLAQEHNCPVITGHADFIFSNAPAGFMWFDHISFQQNAPNTPISGTLYSHSQMLRIFNLDQSNHSSALMALMALLRPDFHGSYYQALNALFGFVPGDNLAMSAHTGDRKATRRLTKIIHQMGSNERMRNLDSIRTCLENFPNASIYLMRDFTNILETYSRHHDNFASTEFALLLERGTYRPGSPSPPPRSPTASTQLGRVSSDELHAALTKRESTAEFLFSLSNTHFSRPRGEDSRLYRSTFSFEDSCRQYLLDNALPGSQASLRLFDRRLRSMEKRSLRRSPKGGDSKRIDDERLLSLFHTNERELAQFAASLTNERHIDVQVSHQLAMIMLLARFALRLLLRRDYNNEPPPAGSQLTVPSSRHLDLTEARQSYLELREPLYIALLNSFLFHAHPGEQPSELTPADVRVALGKIGPIAANQNIDLDSSQNRDNYIRFKHLVESLNSVLHGYQEMNSLYNHLARRLQVGRFFDGVLVYKLMNQCSKRNQEYFLGLSEGMKQLLDLGRDQQ